MDNTVFQIIDANLNRTREGFRVVEEIARFVIRDEKLTKKIKAQRHKLAKLFKNIPLIEHRDTSKDLGRYGDFDNSTDSQTTGWKPVPLKSAPTTKKLSEITKRNLKRVQEGCRTMEEFSKLFDESVSKIIKEIRFTAYDIEKEMDWKIRKLKIED